jgi:hypothetical protein
MIQKTTVKSIADASSEKIEFAEIDAKYNFMNFESANGPFGKFEFKIYSNESVTGTMELDTIWGLGTRTYLNLKGTCSTGGNNNVLELVGDGYEIAWDQGKYTKHSVQMKITINIEKDWKKGRLFFSVSLPEVVGGLPIKLIYFYEPNKQ